MYENSITSSPEVRKAPTLEEATNKLHNVISNIEEQVSRTENALGRLINPRPVPAGKDGPSETDPCSHEAQLSLIARRLDRLLGRTSAVAGQLNETI